MSEIETQMEIDFDPAQGSKREKDEVVVGDIDDSMNEDEESGGSEDEEDRELLVGMDQNQILELRLRQGYRVDYSSQSAVARAGLSGQGDENEEQDPDYVEPEESEEKEEVPEEEGDIHSMPQ
ncbi:hypothetical protein FRC14_000742 [Serendipita sp. 396]|nr:hypothetical protein FRC14_000742 [Serendipita sp. 396]KAG8830408.1 hypothetical protein FRC18_008143 [Serendipita sp. 400]KAG8869457.1 hypothetical protein FRC20_001434 [Serendipita sp. 405]